MKSVVFVLIVICLLFCGLTEERIQALQNAAHKAVTELKNQNGWKCSSAVSARRTFFINSFIKTLCRLDFLCYNNMKSKIRGSVVSLEDMNGIEF